jgi:hypothetical protein
LLPQTCNLIYTISGLSLNDTVNFGTSLNCVMEGAQGFTCPTIVNFNTTYSYVMDAPQNQAVSFGFDTSIF